MTNTVQHTFITRFCFFLLQKSSPFSPSFPPLGLRRQKRSLFFRLLSLAVDMNYEKRLFRKSSSSSCASLSTRTRRHLFVFGTTWSCHIFGIRKKGKGKKELLLVVAVVISKKRFNSGRDFDNQHPLFPLSFHARIEKSSSLSVVCVCTRSAEATQPNQPMCGICQYLCFFFFPSSAFFLLLSLLRRRRVSTLIDLLYGRRRIRGRKEGKKERSVAVFRWERMRQRHAQF